MNGEQLSKNGAREQNDGVSLMVLKRRASHQLRHANEMNEVYVMSVEVEFGMRLGACNFKVRNLNAQVRPLPQRSRHPRIYHRKILCHMLSHISSEPVHP